MNKVIIIIRLIDIDMQISESDRINQNNRLINLIKIICKHLIPIDIELAKEICYICKVTDIHFETFNIIE